MKILRSALLIMLGFVVTACAIKPPTSSDYDTSFDFSQLKTYAWISAESTNDDSDKVMTLDNKRQINAIETILNQKGFNKLKSVAKADFLLKTHNVTDKKVNVDRFYQTWGYHPFYHPNVIAPRFGAWPHATSTSVREYKVGTLVLDIVDRKTKQVVWRGSVSKPLDIYNNRTPEERSTIAMSNAKHMLMSFPPTPHK